MTIEGPFALLLAALRDGRAAGVRAGRGGRATLDDNRIRVELDRPAETVTLRFRWVEGLAATAPAVVERVEVDPGVALIRVRPEGLRRLESRS